MQGTWDELVAHYSHVTDARNRRIDAEIFETVVVLNALDMPTVMSCGGHIDDGRGLLLPWVEIESTDPSLPALQEEEQWLIEAARSMHAEVAQLREEPTEQVEIRAAKLRADETYARLREVGRQIRILQSEPRKKLVAYLTQFYEGRYSAFDRRLVLQGKDRTRLHSQGALDLYLTAPEAVQRQKLTEYREEMIAFTAFLKKRYSTKQPVHA